MVIGPFKAAAVTSAARHSTPAAH